MKVPFLWTAQLYKGMTHFFLISMKGTYLQVYKHVGSTVENSASVLSPFTCPVQDCLESLRFCLESNRFKLKWTLFKNLNKKS